MMTLRRKALVVLLPAAIFIAIAPLAAAAAGADEGARPNIIFFMVDELGWIDASGGQTSLGNGSKYHQTPSIERLARAGMSFTSAYTLQNCAPARAAFLTGQTAVRNGVYNIWSIEGEEKGKPLPLVGVKNAIVVQPSAITIAETLRASGYATAHFGKFHVGDEASITRDHGFEHNYGGRVSAMPKTYFAEADGKGGWRFNDWVGSGLDAFAKPYTRREIERDIRPYSSGVSEAQFQALVGTPKHLTDATADAAIAFMRRRVPDGQPFFVNLWHYAVHVRLRSRPDLLAKYKAVPRSDPRHKSPEYAGMIEGMDQSLGRILDFLADPNADGNPEDSIESRTLIVFFSDNGAWGFPNTPLRGGKDTLHEGGIRVPMLAAQPGVIPAGSTSDAIVSVTDFYRTFAELAGAPLPSPEEHPLDSFSMVDTLRARPAAGAREALVLHLPGYHLRQHVPSSLITRDVGGTRYKLVYHYQRRDADGVPRPEGRYSMYALESDLGEAHDLLAATPVLQAHRDAAAELSRELIEWLEARDAPYPTLRHPEGEPKGPVSTGPPRPYVSG